MQSPPAPLIRTLAIVITAGSIIAACAKEVVDPPPDPVATSIRITPTSPSIDAIGGQVQLTAAVLDQNGNTISGLSVAWSSDDPGTGTVSTAGLVTGLAVGGVNITATSGSISQSVAVAITQVPAAIAKVSGDQQTNSIGALLATNLVAQVNDALGTTVGSGVGVTFSVTSGGGTLGTASATTDAAGQVTTSWTLGTTSGAQSVTAALTSNASVNAVFSATASAGAPDSMFIQSGDGQGGLVNTALTNPIVARVVDSFGNPVPGVSVSFSVTGGGGALGSTSVSTDANGDASTTWTLGGTAGPNTVEASSAGLKGSPITFNANATTLSLTNIAPDPMVEGGSITLTGTGFDPTPANNTVTIGGTTAAVTAASTTSLTVTVPTRSCQPAIDVNVVVTVGASSTSPVSHRLNPASTLNLSVGQQFIVTDPNAFCLQFLSDATGGDEYLIGVGATHDADASILYSLVAEAGATSAPGLPAPIVASGPTSTFSSGFAQAGLFAPDNPEMRIREWERQHMDPARHPELWTHLRFRTPAQAVAASAQVVPNVGDILSFKVPDINQNICTNFIPITTKVRAVGTHGIIVEDTTNASATTDTLTQADFDHFSASFDTLIYAVDTTYFGAPTDLDTNQRVIMVLTQEVNNFGGVAGFVASVDLVPVSSCASSDFGEIFYGYVPTATQSRQSIMDNMLPLISHEVTHNIQQSRRAAAMSPFMSSWEAEGQADLAKEVVGHAAFGNTPGNDYLNATVTAPISGGSGFAWYQQRFTRLALYFGWNGSTGKVSGDTPAQCSLLGHSGGGVPCSSSYFYGAGWSFHRYVNDRFGPTYSGPGGTGETGLQRDWIGGTGFSFAGVETLLGVSIDTLFAQWAAMLYADGRSITGLPAELQMSSWNMAEIYSNYSSSLSLQPASQTFGAFSEMREVRKGSTAYTLMTAAGARGALAIRLRDQLDGILAGGDKPQLWILRTK